MASLLNRLDEGFLKLQFSARDRLRLYRKLSVLLGNGVNLVDGLDMMWNHASYDGKKPKTVQAVVIDAWRRGVSGGKLFGTAIKDWVPNSDRTVIEAGERAGDLAGALQHACLLNEGQRQINGAVIAGVAYPIVLVITAIAFMVVFGTLVIPEFEVVYPRERWTGLGAQMAAMSDFVRSGLVPSLIGLGVLTVLVIWSMPRWTGKIRAKMDAFPPYSIYRLIVGSGFLLSLAALTNAGEKVTRVLEIMQRSAGPWYRERLHKALLLVREGSDIGDALHRIGYNFPDRDTVNDMRLYAKQQGFDKMMLHLGKQNLDDSITKIKAQSAILRNVGIVFLGVVFMWLAGGIFDLIGQIQASV